MTWIQEKYEIAGILRMLADDQGQNIATAERLNYLADKVKRRS